MRIGPQRPVNPDAIVAPQGYRVEALVTGLSFPSAISFGPGGELYLAESGGVAGQLVSPPRVLRIDPDRSVNEIGRLDNPIVGLVYRNGELFIAEDSSLPRILRVTAEAEIQILVEGLPGGGDYGLSGLSLDAQGALLFGLGTRTNSGVVGLDNLARGWVARQPEAADVPGADVELAGVNYVTSLPTLRGSSRQTTGGFRPFGVRSDAAQTIKGSTRCGGAVYRLGLDGGEREPERLAWGLRNPVGVSCGPDGRIFATEGGMEERGSRPVAAAPDNLWEIQPNGYYGWPDFASGIAVTDPRFRLPGHPAPRKLLSRAPGVATVPLATFAARSGVGRLDFSTSGAFGFAGDALVALSGEWCLPAYAGEEAAHGCRVVRVDPRTGNTVDFLVNRNSVPSSSGNSGGLERPFDVRFDPSGEVLYVVDMGEVHLHREHGLSPYGGTGVVWRITRIRPMAQVSLPDRRNEREVAADEADEADVESDVEEAASVEDEAVVEEWVGAASQGDAEEATTSEEPDTDEPEAEEPAAEEPAAEEPAADAEPAAEEPAPVAEPTPVAPEETAEAEPDPEAAEELTPESPSATLDVATTDTDESGSNEAYAGTTESETATAPAEGDAGDEVPAAESPAAEAPAASASVAPEAEHVEVAAAPAESELSADSQNEAHSEAPISEAEAATSSDEPSAE